MKSSENKPMEGRKSHAFSVILIMVVLSLIGAACLWLKMLTVQYGPTQENLSISVGCSGQGSARVMEMEVTSVLEGVLNTVEGVENVSANTRKGYSSVNLTFKKGTDMQIARFDVSTRLRQIRNKLPEGTSRPAPSGSAGGGGRGSQTLLSYTINADMPSVEIARYANDHIVIPLSRIDGVESVRASGGTPFEWVLTFNPNSLRAVGLTPNNLSEAMSRYFQNQIVGTQVTPDHLMLVRLKTTDLTGELEKIPIGKVNGRMYYMGDFATVKYQEQLPSSYDRINGLNTISLSVSGTDDINVLAVTDAVKQKMEELKEHFPENFAIRQEYDASEHLENEIDKIFLRAVMSLAILLLFVLAVSRSFRYLMVIGLTIVVNLLSAVIFYKLLGVSIELYSLAGITVSLGIIIDTAIVIADHYTYYGNRKVMFSITGALLTTIAALLMVFFLPESSRANLTDFIWVIVINLSLSIIIAFLFVPSLLYYWPLKNKGVVNNTMSRRRRLVKTTHLYERITVWSRAHRTLYIILIVWLFGLPVHLLPNEVRHKDIEMPYEQRTKGGLVGLYNNTIGSKWYQRHKSWFEYSLGGSLNLFQKFSRGRMSFDRGSEEKPEVILRMSANLTEGQNVQQLNAIVMEMENWLQQYPQISTFESHLSGLRGSLEVRFKEEFQNSRFPYDLKQELWKKATRYGGATWRIESLGEEDQALYNNIFNSSWTHSISLYGYNYDLLYKYAEELIDTLKQNRRVNGQAGFSQGYGSFVGSEFYMDLDREKLVRRGTDLNHYLSYMKEQLYDSGAGQVYDGKSYTSVRLVSSEKDYHDLWHMRNDLTMIDSSSIRLSDIGTITKRRTGLDINRENQQYAITVGFEFIGSYELRDRMISGITKRFNERLPMGFSVGSRYNNRYWTPERQRTAIIFLVVVVIFMICAAMFESFRIPLMIVILIPVSFIGMFLAYPLVGVSFGQGGYAALIMLCGITVNAGIYLTSEYRTIAESSGRKGIKTYVKAFNRKIVPTMLTILSTVLGLIPFLFDGHEIEFWYSFAVGVMSGMLFSVIAIVFVMPVFFPLEDKT